MINRVLRFAGVWFLLGGLISASFCAAASAPSVDPSAELFKGPAIRHLRIEISKEGIETLSRYMYRRTNDDERVNVPATIREGNMVWTNVAVHPKGALGSFRPITDKPALTLNFDKFVTNQTFHGLEKISLNNSVQDSSFMNEIIGRELYAAAGVPTPRADYATVELNGRNLGLYVLVEGWNKQFLRRYFNNVKGNFYDMGLGRDLNSPVTASSGQDPTNHTMLRSVVASANRTNYTERLRGFHETLDLDRFISMTALDVMMWNWDGYAMNRNNYRLFHDLDSNRLTFFPHGIDQLFAKTNGPIMTGRVGLVVRSLLDTPEGRELYLKRFAEIRRDAFNVSAITNRISQLAARIQPVLLKQGFTTFAMNAVGVNFLRARVLARGADIDSQLAGVTNLLRLELNARVPLTNWVSHEIREKVLFDRSSSPSTLHLKADGESSYGAWNALTWLDEGRYVIEGRVKTAGVKRVDESSEPAGAGFRVWSDRKETRGANWDWFPYRATRDPVLGGIVPTVTNSVSERLLGDSDWKEVRYEFELRQPVADLQIQCVLQASAGEAWFETSSIRIRRLSYRLTSPGQP